MESLRLSGKLANSFFWRTKTAGEKKKYLRCDSDALEQLNDKDRKFCVCVYCVNQQFRRAQF